MESMTTLGPDALEVELAYRRALLSRDSRPLFRARRGRRQQRATHRAYGRHPGGGG